MTRPAPPWLTCPTCTVRVPGGPLTPDRPDEWTPLPHTVTGTDATGKITATWSCTGGIRVLNDVGHWEHV